MRTFSRVVLLSAAFAVLSLVAVTKLDRHTGLLVKGAGPEATYDILFQTIGSISGVFLGLYFTAIATVVSTVYANAPTATRDILVREKLGSSYVRLVAFIGTFSVGVLALHAIGQKPLGLAVAVAAILTGAGIFAFAALGRRAFQFFDPVATASIALNDFSAAVRRGIALPRPPGESTTQRARVDAERAVAALDSLVALTVRRNRTAAEVAGLLGGCVTASRLYASSKLAIPGDSKWFRTRHEHRRWYLSDSTPLELASSTMHPLSPEEVPDLHWFERALFAPVQREFQRAGSSGDVTVLARVLRNLTDLARVQGATFDVKSALLWLEPTSKSTEAAILLAADAGEEEGMADRLVVLSHLCGVASELEVALFRRIHDLTASDLSERIARVDLARPGAAYRLTYEVGLPRRCLESMELVSKGREFEELSAAKVATPAWYVRDLVANSLLWEVHDQWTAAHTFFRTWSVGIISSLEQHDCHIEAAVIRECALATSWKLIAHIDVVDERHRELRSVLLLKDLQQPAWEADAVRDEFQVFRVQLLRGIAASIPRLGAIPGEAVSRLPDYLGEAVHRTGEACFDALVNGDDELFQSIFELYFHGILTVFEDVRGRVAEWHPETAANWLAAPIVDLVTISGYAKIFGELHGDDRSWQLVCQQWTNWLAENPARLAHVDALVSLDASTFALTPRSLLRTQWEMRLNDLLGDLPREASQDFWREGAIAHQSDLIKKLSPWGHFSSSYTPVDVFAVFFVSGQPGAAGLAFGASGTRTEHRDALRPGASDPEPRAEEGDD